MRTWLRAGAALLIVVTMAACSGTSPGSPPARVPNTVPVIRPPVVRAEPRIDDVGGLRLPIEAYMMTPQQLQMTSTAFAKVLNDCMGSFGFAASEEPSAVAGPGLMTRRYGVTDAVNVAKYGYHTAPGEDRASPVRPARSGEPSAAERAVSYGYPDDPAKDAANRYHGKAVPRAGCHGEAVRRLRFDLVERADPDDLVNQIAIASLHQSETDSRVVAVVRQWSSCMAADGFHYDSPIGMADHDEDLAASFDAPAPTSREIRIAVADVACKRRHNLVGIWFAVETSYQNVMIEQKRRVLDNVRSAIDESMRACAEIGT